MKTIFKNCIVTFKKALTPGTEVEITPDYTGEYAPGLGYYSSPSGWPLTFLENYIGKDTGCSQPIEIPEDFSYIVLRNLISNPYHSFVLFFDDNNLFIKNYRPTEDEGTKIDEKILAIPENAKFLRLLINVDGTGIKQSDYTAYFRV